MNLILHHEVKGFILLTPLSVHANILNSDNILILIRQKENNRKLKKSVKERVKSVYQDNCLHGQQSQS